MRFTSSFGIISGVRSDRPLGNNEIARVAPSIFATSAHESRSERYAYIPTIDVLNALRNEGFQPFMACQTRTRSEEKRDHTKHMIRLRHANQINGREANEIILLNSHDGSSSYQMIAGMFRFVCSNGMVCGNAFGEVRVQHKGNVIDNVIEGAHEILESLGKASELREGMEAITLSAREQEAFAKAALALKYDPSDSTPAPITEEQILMPRRYEDKKDDLWTTLARVQENLIKGGILARTQKGRTTRTRAVTGIDQNVKLNRALWVLAEQMKALKA